MSVLGAPDEHQITALLRAIHDEQRAAAEERRLIRAEQRELRASERQLLLEEVAALLGEGHQGNGDAEGGGRDGDENTALAPRPRHTLSALFLHTSASAGLAVVYTSLLAAYLFVLLKLRWVKATDDLPSRPEVNVPLFELSMLYPVPIWYGILIPLGQYLVSRDLDVGIQSFARTSMPFMAAWLCVMIPVLSVGKSVLYWGIEIISGCTLNIAFIAASAMVARGVRRRKRRKKREKVSAATVRTAVNAASSAVHPVLPQIPVTESSALAPSRASHLQEPTPLTSAMLSARRPSLTAAALLIATSLSDNKRRGGIIRSIGSTLVLLVTVYMYPFVLIPAYRTASSTLKLVIVLGVHPVVMEIGLLGVRDGMAKHDGRNTFDDHGVLFALEATCGLVRRFLITNMGDASLISTAVALTALEELALRATMRGRYFLLRRIRGKPKLDQDALQRRREVWACQINTSAIVEIVSILISAFVRIGMAKNAFVVNLGYTELVEGSAVEARVDRWGVIYSAVLQIALEVLVDTVCFYVEERQGIPVVGWYFERLSRCGATIVYHIVAFLAALHFVLYTYKTVPFAGWCDGEQVGGGYGVCRCDASYGFELWEAHVCGGAADTIHDSQGVFSAMNNTN